MDTAGGESLIHKAWSLLTRGERRRALLSVGLAGIGTVLEVCAIGLVVPVLVLLTDGDAGGSLALLRPWLAPLAGTDRDTLVVGGMLVLVGAFLLKNLYLAFLSWWHASFALRLQTRLSRTLFARYLHQPYSFLLQRNSSELIRNVVGEVMVLINYGVLPGVLLVNELLVVVALTLLLLVFAPVSSVVPLVVLAVAGWGFHQAIRRRADRWGRERQVHEGLRLKHLQQGLGGAKDAVVLGRQADFLRRFDFHNLKVTRYERWRTLIQQQPRLALELVAVIAFALLVIGMARADRPYEEILPTVALFAAVGFRLLPSANRALQSALALRFGGAAVRTLYEELALAEHESSTPGGSPGSLEPLPKLQTEVRLSGVSYTYPGRLSPALDDVSLEIRKGELVGLIGPSGAGKSTLVDVLVGLLPPQRGQVTVDGRDVRGDLRGWQDQLGYVPQAVFLTDDSLKSNVAFGVADERIDEAAVWGALRRAQLDTFVQTLPNGLDTLVGERGVQLSGGERQRVGIARALYRDPEVIVLDEAVGALDAPTRDEVMRAVVALRGSTTVVVVAHQWSTIEHCDRYYRVERGRVDAGAERVQGTFTAALAGD